MRTRTFDVQWWPAPWDWRLRFWRYRGPLASIYRWELSLGPIVVRRSW